MSHDLDDSHEYHCSETDNEKICRNREDRTGFADAAQVAKCDQPDKNQAQEDIKVEKWR